MERISKSRLSGLLIVVIVLLSLASYLFKLSMFDIALIFVVLIVGILSAIYPGFRTFVESVFAGYFKLIGAIVLLIAPALPFSWLAKITPSLSRLSQTIILVLWGALLLISIWLVMTENNRKLILGTLKSRAGIFAPFAYSLCLMWIGLFFFSTWTYFLVENDAIIWDGPANTADPHGAISDFYLWHFINAIPAYKVTETILWEAPLQYETPSVGWLLLSFKIVVISPVIGAFIWYWRDFGKEKKEDQPKVEAIETQTPKPVKKSKKGKPSTRRVSRKASLL
jgi:hypothetical protein